MAEEVTRIKEELGLEPSLPLKEAVVKANEAMGLDAQGTTADQVGCLLKELNIVMAGMSEALQPPSAPQPQAQQPRPQQPQLPRYRDTILKRGGPGRVCPEGRKLDETVWERSPRAVKQ